MKPITEMTPDEKNRELCQMLGIHWHEWDNNPMHSIFTMCKICRKYPHEFHTGYTTNPNFLDDAGAVRLLREVEKQEWGKLFFATLMYSGTNVEAIDDDGYIAREYITTPGLLADKVIEWGRKKKK
jgi:hypothetical protein